MPPRVWSSWNSSVHCQTFPTKSITPSGLDYSAIIEAAVEVLTCDVALMQRVAARVKHVIVDEYRDLNPIQEANRLAVAGTRGQSLSRRRRRSDHLPMARPQRPGHSHLRHTPLTSPHPPTQT